MADPAILFVLLQGAPAGEPPAWIGYVPVLIVVGIFYFLVYMPMKTKQKRMEDLIRGLKSGDKVIINPGIFGTIVGIEDEAFQVRIDDKTKIKVLKSAVSGLQGAPQTEKN
jgi:preprotein translocase subunit YajC